MMYDAGHFFGVAAGIIGASFSLAAACSRWLSLSPTTGAFWIKRFALVLLGFLFFSGAALSQVPGNAPGWWVDKKDASVVEKQKSPKVIVAPHAEIIVHDHIKKRHIVEGHFHVHHHWNLHHHMHHRHRHCFVLFPWCWR